MLNRLLILLVGIAFVGCESKKQESDADKYLKDIRSIYLPIAENHSLIVSNIYGAYNSYHKNLKACDEVTIKKISDLKNKQSQLIFEAKKKLNSIPDDMWGYIQSVRTLISEETYGVNPCWEMMLLNLSYYSPKEQIVFVGSYSNDEPIWDTIFISNDMKIDTTKHFGLTQNDSITNKLGLIGFNGLSIKDYILHLIEPLEKIEFWEAAYCVDNENKLAKDLIRENTLNMTHIYEIKDSLTLTN
jgi:hypothetical protein